MTTVSNQQAFYENWYAGFHVPSNPATFSSFVGTQVIPAELLGEYFYQTKIETKNVPTGMTDGYTITLPTHYFDLKKLGNGDVEKGKWISAALVNGTMIHECNHVVQFRKHGVPCNIKWFADSSDILSKFWSINARVTASIINVMEDCYIDNECRNPFYEMVALECESLFSDFTEFDVSDLEKAMNTFVSLGFKGNHSHFIWSDDEFAKQIFDLYQEMITAAHRKDDFFSRIKITEKVAELFFDKFQDEIENDENKDGDSETDLSVMGAVMALIGIISDNVESVSQEIINAAEYFIYNIVENTADERYICEVLTVEKHVSVHSNDVPATYEFTDLPNTKSIVNAVKYRDATTSLSQPEKKGLKFNKNRAANLWSDGRVFNTRPMVQVTEPEIILLVDLSGSMSNIQKQVLKTAKSFSKSLKGIPHLVAGHSTKEVSGNKSNGIGMIATVGLIDGFKLYQSAIKTPFETAMKYYSYSNADGVAIKEVIKYFTKKNNKKIMIVMSDGMPSATMYKGVDHTKNVVKKLRKQGIIVIALALVPAVVSSLNEIYGSDFVADGYTNLTDSLSQIIRKELRGYSPLSLSFDYYTNCGIIISG